MYKTILIPSAGSGQRFAKMGIEVPKPLIKVDGVTLLERSLSSFKVNQNDTLIITTQLIHEVKKILKPRIDYLFPNNHVVWLEVDELLPGQLSTCNYTLRLLTSSNIISKCDKLYIHNCDTQFTWNSNLDDFHSFGLMAVFQAEGDHWSFGKPSPNNKSLAIEIAEKKRISNLASIGLYGFKSVDEFLEASNNHLIHGSKLNNEFYIAPMLQSAINQGKSIYMPEVGGVQLFGTPKELCKTFEISVDELIAQNITIN